MSAETSASSGNRIDVMGGRRRYGPVAALILLILMLDDPTAFLARIELWRGTTDAAMARQAHRSHQPDPERQ
ncbi:hypothetical protein [Nocardioides sp.]|uniref:hypothetical protein n=1 Tax=Nocardioides sp. TaxID=35761 RepID=UPI001D22D3F4|nr:hypothetical protein [Nocardioides sp.]MBU1801284.1 hypothetical protein [Actinomycetota bacterium]